MAEEAVMLEYTLYKGISHIMKATSLHRHSQAILTNSALHSSLHSLRVCLSVLIALDLRDLFLWGHTRRG